ncbi:MAG: SAM-dependent methyltransferase [Peptostreptococcaceae bacterium]|nr:SAM-dependent methyltransferase [Peptostreptococcaceae bacterium]
MKLSDRLNIIYNAIREGETVADIGTDHGFIPIKLIETGKSPYVVLVDISCDSLEKGRNNVQSIVNEEQKSIIDFRLGDGLKALDFAEVDDIIIAGMGGRLIRDIMSYDIEKTRSFQKFILQPRNHSGELRYWLLNNGFNIVSDILVRENKYIPEILIVESGMPLFDISELNEESIELSVPVTLADNDKQLVIELLERNINNSKKVLDNLLLSSDNKTEMVKEYEYKLEYLTEFMKKVK